MMSSVMVTQDSSPTEKVLLFRSLFRGRGDVYARRFESKKTGKSGYQPACANEWIKGICEKPKIRCFECAHQNWLGLTDEVIRWHLSGEDIQGKPFVMGLYPMLRDETCFFLAVDFDNDGWETDARAFLSTAKRLQVPAYLERSRSGQGGHVWLFFEDAIPCGLARRLGSHMLTETMERRPEIGMGSYDRFFPNQDTLPRGGFGNLIALPLQKSARARGNSVFLDEQLRPYCDQWSFLSSIRKIDRTRVESIVEPAENRGRILGVRAVGMEEDAPWLLPPSRSTREPALDGPLPKTLDLVLADQIYFKKSDLPAGLACRLCRLASFQNPEFYKAQAMRLSVFGIPRVISCSEDFPEYLALPRGCLEDVEKLLANLKIRPLIKDERQAGRPLDARFSGVLRKEQEVAAEAMLAKETGILAATTAFGKTVLAAWLISRRATNTLVLVHRQQLLEQWVERLSSFLTLPRESIGRLGGGKKNLTGFVDVALIQSLVRKGQVDDRIAEYGHVVFDECHHLSAHSFELVARRAKALFVTGLSATVTRKDGHHPIIFMQCGPVRYRVDARKQAIQRPFIHHVMVQTTGFQTIDQPDEDPRLQYQELTQALSDDEARNHQICEDVMGSMKEGRKPLVLTERTSHVHCLAEKLRARGAEVIVLLGGMTKAGIGEARKMMDRRVETGWVIVATGKYVGEGFDDPCLDTLFLALPVSWRGTVAQYAGRLHRLHEGKREVRIYDYADLQVPMLSRMFDRRCRGYEAIGYSILLPASAVPGWPADVPLPVDPTWKQDHSGSVMRLVRDGVDGKLANLFVSAVAAFQPDGQGESRARSASERFLFQRLESLKETQGLFTVNARIPIPFDQEGNMEVDFLCREVRLVIELDGGQHLGSQEAYRRDRRKDEALQRNGYFVLRFLAEDAGKNLGSLLDTILCTLTHLRSQAAASRGNRVKQS